MTQSRDPGDPTPTTEPTAGATPTNLTANPSVAAAGAAAPAAAEKTPGDKAKEGKEELTEEEKKAKAMREEEAERNLKFYARVYEEQGGSKLGRRVKGAEADAVVPGMGLASEEGSQVLKDGVYRRGDAHVKLEGHTVTPLFKDNLWELFTGNKQTKQAYDFALDVLSQRGVKTVTLNYTKDSKIKIETIRNVAQMASEKGMKFDPEKNPALKDFLQDLMLNHRSKYDGLMSDIKKGNAVAEMKQLETKHTEFGLLTKDLERETKISTSPDKVKALAEQMTKDYNVEGGFTFAGPVDDKKLAVVEKEIDHIEKRLNQMDRILGKANEYGAGANQLSTNADADLNKLEKILGDTNNEKVRATLYKEVGKEQGELKERLSVLKDQMMHQGLKLEGSVPAEVKGKHEKLLEKIGSDDKKGLGKRCVDAKSNLDVIKANDQNLPKDLSGYKEAQKEHQENQRRYK